MAIVLSALAPVVSTCRSDVGRRAGGAGRARRAAVSAVGGGGSRNNRGFAALGGAGGEKLEKAASIASGCGSGWRQRPVDLGRRAPLVVVVNASEHEDEVEAVTKKWGLEAGLWKVFRSKPVEGEGVSKMDTAKKLLKRYGSAYLVTSISLSLVSITVCYVLISAGVDVAGLLERVGLSVTTNSERFGTFALAYAAHKAASPIRFPPTVALTPVVAGWLGKEVVDDDDDDDEGAGAGQRTPDGDGKK